MNKDEIKNAAGDAYDKYRGASDSKQKYLLAIVGVLVGTLIGALV